MEIPTQKLRDVIVAVLLTLIVIFAGMWLLETFLEQAIYTGIKLGEEIWQ